MTIDNIHLFALVVPYLTTPSFLALMLVSKKMYNHHFLRARMDHTRYYEVDLHDKNALLSTIVYSEEVTLFIQEGPQRIYLHYPFLPRKIIFYRDHVKIFQDVYHNLWTVVGDEIHRLHKVLQVTRNYCYPALVVYYLTPNHDLWLLYYHESTMVIHTPITTLVKHFDVGVKYCLAINADNEALLIEHTTQQVYVLLQLASRITSCMHLEHYDTVLLTLITEAEIRYHYTYVNHHVHCINIVTNRNIWRPQLAKQLLKNSVTYDVKIIDVACDSHNNFVIISWHNYPRRTRWCDSLSEYW